MPSTFSLKCTWPLAISRSDVTAGLLVHDTSGPAAVGELTRALGAENHQRETVSDLFETIFNGDASQGALQRE